MKRSLLILWLFTSATMRATFQHPAGVVLFTFGKIIRFVMYFTFVYFLLSSSRLLAGYTLSQTLIFFLTFNIIDTLGQLLFRAVYRFRPLVVSGELDGVLVKPYHPFLKILLGGIDILDTIMLLPYALILVWFMVQAGVGAGVNVLWYLLLIVNALLITTGFHIFVLALGVVTTEVDHTIMIYRDLSRMASFPVDIYAEPIRTIITFVIPIGIMMTFPVKALFNLLTPFVVMVSFTIGIGILLSSLVSWSYALRRYQSWGS